MNAIMNLQLTYSEILNYVKSKFHVEPTMKAVDSKTLRITYKMNMFVPAVSVDLHVDSISNGTVVLSYKCSDIVNGLLGSVIGLVEQKIPRHKIEILTDTRQIKIHLNAFEELDRVLSIVEPTGITFKNDAVVLDMTLA